MANIMIKNYKAINVWGEEYYYICNWYVRDIEVLGNLEIQMPGIRMPLPLTEDKPDYEKAEEEVIKVIKEHAAKAYGIPDPYGYQEVQYKGVKAKFNFNWNKGTITIIRENGSSFSENIYELNQKPTGKYGSDEFLISVNELNYMAKERALNSITPIYARFH